MSIATWVRGLLKFCLGAFATLVSAVLSLLAFVILGGLLPMWTMIAIHGLENVQSAPAHGGAILFLTVPFAALLSAIGFCLLTRLFYRWLSRWLIQP